MVGSGPTYWAETSLANARHHAFDLRDMSQIDLTDLTRMLRESDAVIMFDALSDRAIWARGVEHMTTSTKVGAVICASPCQCLTLAVMAEMAEFDILTQARIYQLAEVLERACKCPCASGDIGAECLAREPVAA